MNSFSEPSSPQTVLKQSLPAVRHSGPAAKLLVSVAAFALVAVSIAGYLYHRFQTASMAAEYLRLMVIGPSTLQEGVAARFDVNTAEVTGLPVSVPIEFDLYSPEGKILFGRKESTDHQGRLQVSIPADMSLPAVATLKVQALYQGKREQTSVSLALEPAPLTTQLSLDKPLYQPGETIYYRSLSLSRFGLTVEREIPIHFEILDPTGAVLPNSQIDGTTDRGVGNGTYVIPDDLPGGRYILVARCMNGAFSQGKQKFLIRRYRAQRLTKELSFHRDSYAPGDAVAADYSAKRPEGKPAAGAKLRIIVAVDGQTVLEKNAQTDTLGMFRVEFNLPEKIARGDAQLVVTVNDGGISETISKTIPINLAKVLVHFYPEGGELVAGLENRVYFVSQNPLGRPLHVSGVIVNDKGQIMTAVETVDSGMGQFSFTPRPGESYKLKIMDPSDIKDELKLPAATNDCPIVLNTGTGVFDPSEMLEFNIRSTKAGIPLVVGAWCRGVMVGQAALVTRKNENGINPVVLPLPDEAGGVIRLTVFDYSIDPDQTDPQFPKPLAERLVYRRMARRLNVRAVDLGKYHAPGEKVNVSLAVTDEKNQPVAAVLGVSAADEGLYALAGDHTPDITTRILLTSEIENPQDLENADFLLSEDKSSSARAAAALDLLLGTQGWRRFAEKNRQQSAQEGPEKEAVIPQAFFGDAVGPPATYDNLGRIRAEYQKKLDAYYADRTQTLYTIITISFLGAWGLLFLVFMLGLFRIIRGASFWMPVLGVIVCCVMIGALLMNPRPFAGNNNPAVPFLPYQAPAAKSASESGARSGIKSGGEKTADKTRLRPDRRPEGAAALPGQGPQLEQVIPKANPSRSDKATSDPTTPAKNGHFPVRRYAHQHVAAQGGERGDLAESLFWHPLLIAGADGKVSFSFDLPDSIADFRIQADAHGAARIGSLRMDVSTRKQCYILPEIQ
jgi:hypothetical protein